MENYVRKFLDISEDKSAFPTPNNHREWANTGQKKGDQTDYGLYVMLTLEYFANHHKKEEDYVNFDAFLPLWAGKFTSNTWGAWVCTQTKQALGKYIQVKRTDEKFVKSLGGMSPSKNPAQHNTTS